MKKVFILILVVAATLPVAATDRFFIEDFSIAAGGERQVAIQLENDTEFTAFQADILMPEGLAVTQENGVYQFALTERKGRDHNLTSLMHDDGVIRIMSYSLSVKPYSGNQGALVTFGVTASDDFEGPVVITMRNIRFTTTLGVEVVLDDCDCVVKLLMPGDVNDDGLTTIGDVTALVSFLLGNPVSINHDNADLNGDSGISIGDVTALIARLLEQGVPSL